MDPRTVEINNLRILNDQLAQTIEVMARAQRVRDAQIATAGLQHALYAQNPLAASAFADPTFATANAYAAFNPLLGSPLSVFDVGAAAGVVDPFVTQRLQTIGQPFMTAVNPIAEIARRDQIARQQRHLHALGAYRTFGAY